MAYTHWVSLYQKLKAGTNFIRRYPAYRYKHRINAIGGFDTCSFNLAVGGREAELWLDQYLGNSIKVHVDNPIEPCFEGLVNRIKWQSGGLVFTVSLDKLYNRIQVTHYDNAAGAVNTTTVRNNTDSQAIYGIKQGTLDAGIQATGGGSPSQLPTTLADFAITATSWPRISVSVATGGGSQSLFSVECIGYSHTLEWEIYASALTTRANPNVIIGEILAALANGTTFINNADTSAVLANTAWQQNRLSRNGQTAWQFLQGMQEAGDGSGGTPYVIGIEPTEFGTTTRRFYYRPASTAIEYHTRLSDGLRIRNPFGGLVKPWAVRPDKGVFISDVLVGWSGVGDDPRKSYIESVSYDADTQSVSWASADNITLEGALQLTRMFKPHGTRFGAPVRQTE